MKTFKRLLARFMIISGFSLFLIGLIGGVFATSTSFDMSLFTGSSLISLILGGFVSFLIGAELHLRTADR